MNISPVGQNSPRPVSKSKYVRMQRFEAAQEVPVKDRRKGERRQRTQLQRGFEMRSGRDRRQGNIDISL